MEKGKFIVFEGLNGCGKGTQLEKFTEYIFDLNRKNTIFRTREPNEFDENGKHARELLSSGENPYETGLAALGYFALNRQTHNKIFAPMLEKGIYVFCDRYWYSNFAFQHAQGIEYEQIARLNNPLKVPDLTFIIDVGAQEAFNRLNNRDGKNRRIFDSDLQFMEKVRNNYNELGKILPNLINDKSIVYIDGMQPIEKVFENIKTEYNKKFNLILPR